MDTSGWEQPRDLLHFPAYLKHYASDHSGSTALSAASKKKGSPHTLVVTSAGLRAADIARSFILRLFLCFNTEVHRALRMFQSKDAAVAKLFAKHIKLKDAIAYAKSTRYEVIKLTN